MKDKELNILEGLGKVLEQQSPEDRFNKIRVFSIIFENLDDFLFKVNRAIARGSLEDINRIKNKTPGDLSFWEALNRSGVDRLSSPEVCNYYTSTFEDIRKWGLRLIATHIKECLEEYEGEECKS